MHQRGVLADRQTLLAHQVGVGHRPNRDHRATERTERRLLLSRQRLQVRRQGGHAPSAKPSSPVSPGASVMTSMSVTPQETGVTDAINDDDRYDSAAGRRRR